MICIFAITFAASSLAEFSNRLLVGHPAHGDDDVLIRNRHGQCIAIGSDTRRLLAGKNTSVHC
jgi:hypothetical protein